MAPIYHLLWFGDIFYALKHTNLYLRTTIEFLYCSLLNLCEIIYLQKDVFIVSCDLVTDIALHHLADIHRSHDATLSTFLAPVPQTSADREAANNPKAKKKTDTTGAEEIMSYYL